MQKMDPVTAGLVAYNPKIKQIETDHLLILPDWLVHWSASTVSLIHSTFIACRLKFVDEDFVTLSLMLGPAVTQILIK